VAAASRHRASLFLNGDWRRTRQIEDDARVSEDGRARIHHLNCGTLCPFGRRLINGDGGLTERARLVCHVLLLELADGLVLVDTGFGTSAATDHRQVGALFRVPFQPQLELGETAATQIRELGFSSSDVRHVVLTHLDIDHAGALPDFPGAEVHVSAREHAVMSAPPLRERLRYALAAPFLAHGPRWTTHDPGGDHWQGFESVQVLSSADTEVLMIPLPGHSLGHTGIAVRDGEGWLLHAGDAFFHRDEMAAAPHCPPGLRAFEASLAADGRARRENQERLRELAARDEAGVRVFCSHDSVQLEQAQALRASA
jgi:glyoxylase-like metal-dependent hydrolase (beta-lactamase superfamily II)